MTDIELLQQILNRLDIISACLLLIMAWSTIKEVYKLLIYTFK